MRLKTSFVIWIMLFWCLPTFGQSTSCLDQFEDFETFEAEVNPTARNQNYLPTMIWYKDCILVGSNNGLWLFDQNHPIRLVQLVSVEDRAINNIAVNQQTFEIAFNVAQEPVVYLINSDMDMSAYSTDRQAITAISFSPDGSLMAVASSDISDEYGIYSDSLLQLWNLKNNSDIVIISDISIIPELFFSKDSRHLLAHDIKPGYFGDEVAYWNIDTGLLLWNYVDLLDNIQPRTIDDSVAITTIAMQDEVIAFGGLDGYYNDRNFYGFGVHFWNSQTQQLLTKIRVQNRYDEEDIYNLPYLVMSFDNRKSMLATSLGDNSVKIWDIETGQQLNEFILPSSSVQELLFNSNAGLLAVLSEDRITIFDIERMEEVVSFKLVDDMISIDK